MSYVKYGAYQHPDNEANLTLFSVRPLYSSRGFKWGARYTMEIQGEILDTTQSGFQTKVNALINAYADNGYDFGFYDGDGVLTNHSLTSSASLSGTKIVLRDWPKSDGAEWATKRTYRIRVQADFVELENDTVQYDESVINHAGAGTVQRYVNVRSGSPVLQTVREQSYRTVIRHGSATGHTGYPVPPGPLSGSGSIELVDQRKITYSSPQRDRNGYYNYRTEWMYVMQSNQDVGGIPNPGP